MGFLSGLVNGMIKESTGYDVRKVTRLVGSKNLLMLGAGAALAGGVAGAMQNQGGAAGPSGSAVDWDAPRGPAPAAPPPPAIPTPPPAVPSPAASGSALAGVSVPAPSPIPSSIPAAPTPVAAAAPPPDLPPVPQGAPPIPVPQGAPPLPAKPTMDPAGVEAEPEPELSPELTFAIVRSMIAAAMADGHLDDREKKIVLDRLEESNLTMEHKQQVHRDLALPPQPAELAAMTEDPEQREAMYRFAGLLVLADGEIDVLERSFLDRLASVFDFDAERKANLEAEIFA